MTNSPVDRAVFDSAVSESAAAGGAAQAVTLRRSIGRFGYFALAFGTIIGSAWLVVLGDWLHAAGPGGAMLGFLAGGVVMTLMAAIYAELCARMPEAGGEFIFAYRLFGERTAFIVGWFVTLNLIATTAFEAIVLPWMLQSLFPQLRGPVLYTLMGEQVTVGAVAIGMLGVVLITFLNYRDVRLAVTFQSVLTYGFLAVVVLVLLVGAAAGETTNLEPLFASGSGQAWWLGAFWIFANSAFFLSGFQSIPQAIEERSPGISMRTVTRTMIWAVMIAVAFYCAAILCSSLAAPWRELAGSSFATAAAVKNVLPGGLLAKVVLLMAAVSLLKTWNAVALMASRLLMAQARQGLLPGGFARIHPRHATPGAAVLFVGACSLSGMLLGRGAVLPLVNMASIGIAFTFVLSCVAVLRLRRRAAQQPGEYRAPGGTATIVLAMLATLAMALIALFEPLSRSESVPLEWILIGCWAGLGVLFKRYRTRSHLP